MFRIDCSNESGEVSLQSTYLFGTSLFTHFFGPLRPVLLTMIFELNKQFSEYSKRVYICQT